MTKWFASRPKGIIPWGRKSRKNKRNSLLFCSLKQNFVPLDKVLSNHGVGSGDHFEMKICPSVNFVNQQMICLHFFVFAVPKFGCLWKYVYFCPRHKEKLEKNDHQNRSRDLSQRIHEIWIYKVIFH